MKKLISNCCGAQVKVCGGVTKYYVCRECLEPCELAEDDEELGIYPIFK